MIALVLASALASITPTVREVADELAFLRAVEGFVMDSRPHPVAMWEVVPPEYLRRIEALGSRSRELRDERDSARWWLGDRIASSRRWLMWGLRSRSAEIRGECEKLLAWSALCPACGGLDREAACYYCHEASVVWRPPSRP